MNPLMNYQDIRKAILSKMKKRMFKKPNLQEAVDSFGNLTKQLEKEECPEYAALYTLEQAQCESSIGNVNAEAVSLLKAGHYFLQCHEKQEQLNVLGTSDCIDWTVACVTKAAKLYESIDSSGLAITCHLNLADSLKKYHFYSEAVVHYKQCVAKLCFDYKLRCSALQSLALCFVKLRDFVSALDAIVKAQATLFDEDKELKPSSVEIFQYLEIWRVLLALLIDPHGQRFGLVSFLPNFMEYLSPTESELIVDAFLEEDLFILLQSLIQACLSKLPEKVEPICEYLVEFCDYEQTEIIREFLNAFHESI